jgi:hypothetical protein
MTGTRFSTETECLRRLELYSRCHDSSDKAEGRMLMLG